MDSNQAQYLVKYLTKLWEGEFPATRKVIAAVPDDRRDYRPDDKSRNAWELATHLALGDIWFLQSIQQGAFNYDPTFETKLAAQFTSIKDVVEYYEREFPANLEKVRALPAEKLTAIVDFFGMMQQPNATYLGFANNHSIHHRGQLASYLRAMGSKVPAIYGASADEPMVATA
jgi:uncharacterized damage-inducible protein DinB